MCALEEWDSPMIPVSKLSELSPSANLVTYHEIISKRAENTRQRERIKGVRNIREDTKVGRGRAGVDIHTAACGLHHSGLFRWMFLKESQPLRSPFQHRGKCEEAGAAKSNSYVLIIPPCFLGSEVEVVKGDRKDIV